MKGAGVISVDWMGEEVGESEEGLHSGSKPR